MTSEVQVSCFFKHPFGSPSIRLFFPLLFSFQGSGRVPQRFGLLSTVPFAGHLTILPRVASIVYRNFFSIRFVSALPAVFSYLVARLS